MAHMAGSPDKGTVFSETRMLQCGTRQLDLSQPVVMGILNITPDSFYDGGRHKNIDEIIDHAGAMITEGATIIDIGAVSTRPGAAEVNSAGERERLMPVLQAMVQAFPDTIISVDTYHSSIARECCELGAGIINDISGGMLDAEMLKTISKQQAAYIIMHMQGTPQTMQLNPQYQDVVTEIGDFFKNQLSNPALGGKQNIILDPGFGFGKSVTDNYRLLNGAEKYADFGFPLMAGFSRKSMINKILHTSPDQALNGTTVLNTIALLKGFSILRVHDVKEAIETIKLVGAMKL